MIVVDTNVIAYFLVPGEATLLAEKVRQKDQEWVAPILWRSEMRSVLMGYLRNGSLDLKKAQAIMTSAESLLSGREYHVESNRVLELANNSGCTPYDCEFVSLAERFNVPLVTSDKKLLDAFPDLATAMDEFTAV